MATTGAVETVFELTTTGVEDTTVGATIVDTTTTGTEARATTGTTTGTDETTEEVILVEETTTGTEDDLVDTVTGTTAVETTATPLENTVVDAGLVVEIKVLFVLAEETGMGVTTCEVMVQGQLDSDSTISTALYPKR